MPRIGGGKPPSRQGKKQVIAYLRAHQVEAAYDRAAREMKTNQEVIGEALNAVYALHGRDRLVKGGHDRIVRRGRGRAREKGDDKGPICRAGRYSYGGWFEEAEVAFLVAFATEVNLSVQQIVETGIAMVTGVGPSSFPDVTEGGGPPETSVNPA